MVSKDIELLLLTGLIEIRVSKNTALITMVNNIDFVSKNKYLSKFSLIKNIIWSSAKDEEILEINHNSPNPLRTAVNSLKSSTINELINAHKNVNEYKINFTTAFGIILDNNSLESGINKNALMIGRLQKHLNSKIDQEEDYKKQHYTIYTTY